MIPGLSGRNTSRSKNTTCALIHYCRVKNRLTFPNCLKTDRRPFTPQKLHQSFFFVCYDRNRGFPWFLLTPMEIYMELAQNDINDIFEKIKITSTCIVLGDKLCQFFFSSLFIKTNIVRFDGKTLT